MRDVVLRPARARSGPAPALAAADRLAGFPAVRRELEARGVALDPGPDESADAFENRIGTRLMALYRDTRSGDAFEALYAFARPAVLSWIKSLLHRGLARLDPSELLQDTFVNVFRYPSGFREDHAGSFRVWVRTIAGNLVRRASAPRARVSFQELPDGLQEPADGREDPVRIASEDEQGQGLRAAWMLFLWHYGRAFRELSDRDRQALHLVEVEGKSYQEAGSILGVRRSNMKMIVFRSRKRIARRMRAAMSSAPAAASNAA